MYWRPNPRGGDRGLRELERRVLETDGGHSALSSYLMTLARLGRLTEVEQGLIQLAALYHPAAKAVADGVGMDRLPLRRQLAWNMRQVGWKPSIRFAWLAVERYFQSGVDVDPETGEWVADLVVGALSATNGMLRALSGEADFDYEDHQEHERWNRQQLETLWEEVYESGPFHNTDQYMTSLFLTAALQPLDELNWPRSASRAVAYSCPQAGPGRRRCLREVSENALRWIVQNHLEGFER